ncbi:hypothetical protein [Streptomyces monashensis]|uniref:Uncharacterized protein n=1 Tax=Streptomyces monashensis TaxID=1678012 RepID=A0A1S2PYH1_9ACTN|nr:hypothetical protein [Streptomyces monashensis]OIJ98500.1 hypothetical protein BIV23_29530 [Streptomyces monashensis]
MKAAKAVASFDSATGMLRALSRFLAGRDVPALGKLPAALELPMSGLLGALNRLPTAARERAYAASGWAEAIPQHRVGDVRSEALAAWVTAHYLRPGGSRPPAWAAGGPLRVSPARGQAASRAAARAARGEPRAAGSVPAGSRQAVGAEATVPRTSGRSPSRGRSAIASPSSASITAASTAIRPGSWPVPRGRG